MRSLHFVLSWLPVVWSQMVELQGMPPGLPSPPPSYMVDNQGNTFGAAPDKGVLNGPVTSIFNDLNRTISNVTDAAGKTLDHTLNSVLNRRASGYWLAEMGDQGQMPYAPSGYKFFRDVTEYGAVGDGITDDTAAINRAVSDGDRCGEGCGSTSVLGALVYFPPGTYLVTTPIIQYYYTQFVGNPQDPPTIKGSTNFSGIALIDTDVYIPKANGDEWYINQNQFYRQIRNFIIDLTQMPNDIVQGDQTYVPCGIHWQVAQATSLQNIVFNMPVSGQVVNSGSNSTKAVGIFQENGSGGFVSDLTFNYGNIGYRAGSQQMTARNLVFNSCLTAVSSIWNWGWVWQSITVNNCYQAFDCSNFGGIDGQGTGSMSIIDSHFNSVPYAIGLTAGGPYPALYLDNLLVDGPNSHQIVFYSGNADSLLEVTQGDSLTVNGWAMGHRFQDINDEGNNTHGYISPNPKRSSSLNSNNNLFAVSRPQYASLGSGDVVNVLSKGVKNDGTGDQTSLINSILSSSVGSLVFFPAGVYIVKGTVEVPVGSKIVGSAWSQIMASGSYFEDETDPKVMFRVGKPGDSGTVELSDLMFTVQGATAGAILVEWNVKATSQGSAGMWDCHFRVGGAAKSRLQFKDCPKGASDVDPKCIAASLLMHVTKQSSGYFENIWGWTADHDLDLPVEGNTTTSTQLNVYAGRGFLIESQGPSWFYGSSVEHNVLYQYQLVGAKDIYLGCMQTETPYFQPNPPATKPFTIGKFTEDPTYPMCDSSQDNCEEAYALRILNSTDIFVYGAGLYSFFFDFTQGCLTTESCQQRLVETSYSQGVWVLNLFTKGAIEVASPLGGILPVYSNDTQEQYTTEVSVWTPLGDTGADIGGYVPGNSSDGVTTDGNNTYVFIDPSVWTEEDPTIQCQPPCTFILPPFQLSTTTTITFPLYTTSLNVAWTTTVTYTDTSGRKTSSKTVTRTVQTTTLTIPAVTTTAIPYWEVPFPNPTAKDPNNTVIYVTESIQPSPFVITDDPNPERKSGVTHPLNTQTITPPPYPYSFTTPNQEPTPTNRPSSTTTSSSSGGAVVTHRTSSHTPTLVTIHTGRPSPTCRSLFGCGTRCKLFCHGPCLLNCTPHNTDWPDSNDPEPPTPPPGPPPGSEECQEGDEGCGDDEEEDEKCDASLSTSTGLCANGNFPFYNPSSGTVDCGVDSGLLDLLGGDDAIFSCQRVADEDPASAEDLISAAQSCCDSGDSWQPLGKRSDGLNMFGLLPRAPKPKAACPNPPAVPYYKANPPFNGICHRTYTCDGDPVTGFPNVCANARSAISSRGRTSVLTYKANADFHDTEIWAQGKYGWKGSVSVDYANRIRNGDEFPKTGWGLIGCEIEEYPFGSGHPTKSKPRTNVMNTRSVNRLIYRSENGGAGRDLSNFYRTAGNDAQTALGIGPGLSPFELADGLIYCVDFKNTPTTNDDAGYLLDSTAHNRCAEPYGIEFTLANQGYTGPLPPRTIRYQLWDPWFDVVAGRKTQKVVKRVPNEPDQLMDLPPQYCLHPSPGTKIWNEALGGWANDDSNGVEYGEGSPRSDPGVNGINLRCFDVPGGNPVKRDLAASSNETTLDKNTWETRDEQHHGQDSSSSGLDGRVVQHLRSLIGLAANKLGNWHSGLAKSGVQVSSRRRTDDQPRIKGRQAVANALGLGSGGSFTDGSVYKHFVCPNDDYDPCANGDSGCDSSYAMGQYADFDYVSLDSKVYTGPTSGLGTSTGTVSGPTKESSTTTKTSSIPISVVTITTTLPTPTHTPPPPTTTTTYVTVDKPPPHTTVDVPPPPTTTPPIFSYNNDEYPGEFEFYFHSQQQLGPNHEPFKLITGLAGFERPEGTDWEVCRMNGINLVSEKETYVGDAEVPEMKSSIATVRAYGDTCSYAETQNEHDADEGDVVGNLTCPKLGDATCIKGTDHATACYTVFFTSLVLCSWN